MTLTARQWLAQELVKDANAMPGKVADFFLYGGNLDRIAVLARSPALATVVQFVTAKSNLQRGGAFTSSGLANTPAGYNGIDFESPPISSVDRIVIETGAGELTFNIPLLPALNAATFDPLAPQFPRDQPVGVTATGPASDRQLVVYEANPTNPDAGRLIAIPPVMLLVSQFQPSTFHRRCHQLVASRVILSTSRLFVVVTSGMVLVGMTLHRLPGWH